MHSTFQIPSEAEIVRTRCSIVTRTTITKKKRNKFNRNVPSTDRIIQKDNNKTRRSLRGLAVDVFGFFVFIIIVAHLIWIVWKYFKLLLLLRRRFNVKRISNGRHLSLPLPIPDLINFLIAIHILPSHFYLQSFFFFLSTFSRRDPNTYFSSFSETFFLSSLPQSRLLMELMTKCPVD